MDGVPGFCGIIPGYVPHDATTAAMFSSVVAPWSSISINSEPARRQWTLSSVQRYYDSRVVPPPC